MYLTYNYSLMKNEYTQIYVVKKIQLYIERSSPIELLTDKTNKKLALNSILFCIIPFHVFRYILDMNISPVKGGFTLSTRLYNYISPLSHLQIIKSKRLEIDGGIKLYVFTYKIVTLL